MMWAVFVMIMVVGPDGRPVIETREIERLDETTAKSLADNLTAHNSPSVSILVNRYEKYS